MAGPLDAIMSAFQTAPVIAQSRLTRTPIVRGQLPDRSAEFHAPNPLLTIARSVVGLPPSSGYIVADESNGGFAPGTIRHESIHAALQPTAGDLLKLWGSSRAAQLLGPAARSVGGQIPAASARGADPDTIPQETAAYVGANPSGAGIAPGARAAALNEILTNMPHVYPESTASLYRRLITKD